MGSREAIVIDTVNWLHQLNYETIARSSSTSIFLNGERNLVRPSNLMDGVTYFHVSYPSLVRPGIVLCSDSLILRMV